MRPILVLSVVLWVTTTCMHVPLPPASLDERAWELAGLGAIDCGEVSLDQDPTDVMRCALTAFQEKNPFVAFMAVQGIDSSLREALVRTPGGQHYRVFYDSNICGGPNRGPGCGPRSFARMCEPSVIFTSEGQIFSCTSDS